MSFWSKLGNVLKVAAPIAASVIPGLGPIASIALGGAGAGVGQAMSGGSLASDMLAGGMGAIPGVVKGVKGPASGSTYSGGSATPDASSPSMWSNLVSNIPGAIQAGATGVNAASKAAADNRGAQASIGMDTQATNNTAANAYQQQLLARAASDRAGQDDAWKKLQQTSYVANNQGSPGGQFSPYTRAIAAPSADVKAGANALMGQSRDALMAGEYNTNGGAPLPMPTDRSNFQLPSSVLNPGTTEKVGAVAGPALDMISQLLLKKKTLNTAKA